MKNYYFTIHLKDKTDRHFESTSLQALMDYIYYNPRKIDFEMYDIQDIELVRRYIYRALSDNKQYVAYVNDRLYEKLVNEYYLDAYKTYSDIDDYIRYVLAYNK